MRSSITWLAVIPLVTAATGCSFVFSEGPPARHETMRYFDCTPSLAPPVLDTVAAGLFVVSAAGVASAPDEDESIPRSEALAIPIGAAVLTGASALYGYVTSARCRDAKRQWTARVYGPWLRPP